MIEPTDKEVIESLQSVIRMLGAENERLRKDAARLDWLDTMDVEIRKPLGWGSAKCIFRAAPDEDDVELPPIRDMIDKVMGSPKQ